jgi:hypothetical protein
MFAASISSNTTEERQLWFISPGAIRAHPATLLREDVIPATGKTEAEIARLLASRANIFTIFCGSANRGLLL